MRRATLVALLALLVTPVVAAAPAGAEPGPRCADYVFGSGSWNGSQLAFRTETARPSCRFVTYTLYVYDEATDTTPLVVSRRTGDGVDVFTDYILNVSDTDGIIYVYGTTSVGRHIFDRGPDDGLFDLTSDGSSGGKTFH
jgi:hypothetical protein